MLTDLDVKHTRNLNMVGTLSPAVFDLNFLGSPEFPWQLKNVSGFLISGPPINILGVLVSDENSNPIYNIPMQPWTLGGTISNVNSNQSPEAPFVTFFGTVIVGIPSDFYVFSNWTLTVNLLNAVPGSGYNITAHFMEGYFGDKYQLST